MLDFNQFDYLVFDCYGTLIDWERGILDTLRPVLRQHGVERSDDELLELFGELESAAERPPYQTYRDVLTSVMDGLGERLGFTPTEDERTVLAESVGDWPTFPDTVEALRSLSRRYRLVILSNVDDDLFALSARRLEVEFADVITAQQVGSYKPDPRNFRRALERCGGSPERVLHVAQSLFHDIAPAKALGLTTVWVNRRHDRSGFGATPPAAAAPDLEVPDLRTLARLAADWDLDTLLVHGGQEPDPQTGAIVPPIHASSTFVRQGLDDGAHFRYARQANPTREMLEAILAKLEHGVAASAFGSGMAAITAVLNLLSSGDHAVVGYDCYLTTYDLFANDLTRFGISADFVDLRDLAAVRRALRPNTRMIWIETPTNPLLDIVDLQALATLGRETGMLTVVDNTFASPYCQCPIDWGIDLVVHSTTKYLGGHSDLVGGAVISRTEELAARISDRQYNLGAVPSPFDCWLLIRGIRTLGVRMGRQMENAQAIAEWLTSHPKVVSVRYPGLPDHPGHELARRQMPGGFSGMVSFTVEGGSSAARKVSGATRLFMFATSLGGVESLIFPPTAWLETAPELMAQIPGSPWAQHPGLLRLSVGIESARDLIADLDQALATV